MFQKIGFATPPSIAIRDALGRGRLASRAFLGTTNETGTAMMEPVPQLMRDRKPITAVKTPSVNCDDCPHPIRRHRSVERLPVGRYTRIAENRHAGGVANARYFCKHLLHSASP